MLNKSKGNMYPWVTHTWNPIRGICPHQCIYCYMKGKPVGRLRLVDKQYWPFMGKEKTIFVGSSIDMFAKEIPAEWICAVLEYCRENHFRNTYLFQTKNPARYLEFLKFFPVNTILGTTIETTELYAKGELISRAPYPIQRAETMKWLNYPKMISIEPVMIFSFNLMVGWIQQIKPEFVSIGADSKEHDLPEPSAFNLKNFIQILEQITEVKLKENLNRILNK